nr:hypothetical protein Iba_chr07cCG7420 [Ipomoea batatas]
MDIPCILLSSALNSLGLESFDAVTALAFCILFLFSVALRKFFIRIVNEVVCHADRSPSSSSWYKTISSYDILQLSTASRWFRRVAAWCDETLLAGVEVDGWSFKEFIRWLLRPNPQSDHLEDA